MFNLLKYLRKCILALSACLFMVSACTEEIPYLTVSQNAVVAPQETTRFCIVVDSNTEWTAESRADWIRLYSNSGNGSGTFEMLLDTNHSSSERHTEVVVAGPECTSVITVIQSSSDLSLVTPVTDYYINADAQDLDIEYIVSCNDAIVKAFSNTDWVKTGTIGDGTVKVSVAENTGGAGRDAEVKVSGASNTGKAVVNTVIIHQGGTDNILDVLVDSLSIASLGETVKIPVQTNSEIDASSSSEWCSVAVSESDVLISADENISGETRTAVVTVYVTSHRGVPLSKAITVTQESVAIGVSIPIAEYTIDNTSQDVVVKYLQSSPDFILEGFSSAKWASITSVSDGAAVVSVEKNSGRTERVAEIALTATNAKGVAFTAKTCIRQSETAKDLLEILVPEVNVNADGDSMKIPFNANTKVTAKSSAYWCSAKVDGSDVAIDVSKNVGLAREAYVTLTTEGGESGIIKITQSQAQDSIDLPVKEISAKSEGGTVRVPYTDESRANVSSNVEWCTVSIGGGYIIAELQANPDENIREAYITVRTVEGKSGLVHILQAAKSKDTLEILTPEVKVAVDAATLRIPFTSNVTVEARSNVDWMTVTIDGKDIVAEISANSTDQIREGYITLTTEGGAVDVAHITQEALFTEFEFENTEISLPYTAESASTLLTSTGQWKVVDESSIPAWLTISPVQGDGNTIITVAALSNKFANSRTASIYFQSTEYDGTAIINVIQEGNPNGLVEFLHLGKGYDASGKYAEEAYVKGKVLDSDKLVAGDHIADLLTPNATVEEVVTGKTLSEYEEKYSANAGISGEYMGFSASVEFNFSENARGTSEYSFATLRHMAKKQILKIYENETAADLKDCLSELFTNDVANAVAAKGNSAKFTDAANALLDKYGTHVITGFSLGGVLEYSMAADASSSETETDWGLAVKAGFEKEGVGSVSTSDGYNQYNRLKTESLGFESKLVCRGGESQYTSSGYGEDAGKTAAAYVDWLTSLEDKSKWVLIDYEGSGLIPLWDYVNDADLAAKLEALAKDRLTGLGQQQQSGYKTLEILFVGVESTHYDGNDSNTEWSFNLTSTIDKKSSTKRTIYSATNSGQIDVEQSTESKTYRTDVENATSGTFSLSKTQSHTVTIELTDCYEDDGGGALNDKKPDNSVTLTYEPGHDYWSYLGFRDGEANTTLYAYDKDASGSNLNKEIYLYGGADQSGDYVRFVFKINWK